MIRFLNLKNQIEEGWDSFAFYDTISDTILSFGTVEYGNIDTVSIFSSEDEFIRYYKKDRKNDPDGGETSTRPLSRFLSLIPKDYFNKNNNG